MQTATLSPKYQIIIPKQIRIKLELKPGQKMQIFEQAGRIELLPERDITELRGFLKGIDTSFEREGERL